MNTLALNCLISLPWVIVCVPTAALGDDGRCSERYVIMMIMITYKKHKSLNYGFKIIHVFIY